MLVRASLKYLIDIYKDVEITQLYRNNIYIGALWRYKIRFKKYYRQIRKHDQV